MPLLLGHSYSTSFTHLHDYEPAPLNHIVPHYGLFSYGYFPKMMSQGLRADEKLYSNKKNHGPPHYHFPAKYDPLSHNEFLQKHGVDLSEVRHPDA